MATEGGGSSIPSYGARHNEDAYLVQDGLGLYVVADGASDGPAGEVAARIAVEALEEFVRLAERPSLSFIFRSFPSKGFAFDAVSFALERVLAASEHGAELEGMRTTVTMLLVHEGRAVAAHVGDSRLYLMRDGEVYLLTEDHELTVGPQRPADREPIQCFALETEDADSFILCTDGVGRVMQDPRIRARVADGHPRDAAARIVAAARRTDPERDVTVVIVRFLADDDGWLLVSEPVSPWAHGHTLDYAGAVS